jgi:hypothetical protein
MKTPMRSLYLRIYLTVVAGAGAVCAGLGLAGAAPPGGRARPAEAQVTERVAAWAELMQRSLPAADAPPEAQAAALRDWAAPAPADGAGRRSGQRIAASDPTCAASSAERPACAPRHPLDDAGLDDGRTLWVLRAPAGASGPEAGGDAATANPTTAPPRWAWPRRPGPGTGRTGWGAAGGAVPGGGRRCLPGGAGLTRRLEALKQGVEAFGAGALAQRVAGRAATRWRGGRQLQPGRRRASRRWCASRTRACWPMPATNCARRWRG